jgi:hypothetical protein
VNASDLSDSGRLAQIVREGIALGAGRDDLKLLAERLDNIGEHTIAKLVLVEVERQLTLEKQNSTTPTAIPTSDDAP